MTGFVKIDGLIRGGVRQDMNEEVPGLRILALVQGEYGDRIVRNINERGPRDWKVESLKPPGFLPPVIDEPEEFLPEEFPASDLILSLGETPQVAQLLSATVKMTRARAVICPIDSNAWLPPGLKNQIEKEMDVAGVSVVFPKPFCSLYTTGDKYIDSFARHFGRPLLKIRCNDVLNEISVIRGSPCGSTNHMAERAIGLKVGDAREKCALTAHHYPCLASMEFENELGDTIMHKSGFLVMAEVERAIVECLGRRPETWK